MPRRLTSGPSVCSCILHCLFSQPSQPSIKHFAAGPDENTRTQRTIPRHDPHTGFHANCIHSWLPEQVAVLGWYSLSETSTFTPSHDRMRVRVASVQKTPCGMSRDMPTREISERPPFSTETCAREAKTHECRRTSTREKPLRYSPIPSRDESRSSAAPGSLQSNLLPYGPYVTDDMTQTWRLTQRRAAPLALLDAKQNEPSWLVMQLTSDASCVRRSLDSSSAPRAATKTDEVASGGLVKVLTTVFVVTTQRYDPPLVTRISG